MRSLISVVEDAIRCIAPRLCQVCTTALPNGSHFICLNCEDVLPTTMFHFQKNNPFIDKFFGRIPLNAGSAYLYFSKKGVAQHLVHQLKYKGNTKLGINLGERYGFHLKESPLYQNIDFIIPVPLHKKREYNRGYNQSNLFAQGLSRSMEIPYEDDLVIRSRKTSTQTKKTRLQRFNNVDGAFQVVRPEFLKDKHVLLVDDILTTGATLEACAQELLKIPGISISMATIGFAYFQ